MCFEPIVPISTCNWLMGRNEFKVKMIKATCGYFVEIESDFETLSFYDFYINTMSNSKFFRRTANKNRNTICIFYIKINIVHFDFYLTYMLDHSLW